MTAHVSAVDRRASETGEGDTDAAAVPSTGAGEVMSADAVGASSVAGAAVVDDGAEMLTLPEHPVSSSALAMKMTCFFKISPKVVRGRVILCTGRHADEARGRLAHVPWAGIEPATCSLGNRRSIRLSYKGATRCADQYGGSTESPPRTPAVG